MQRRGRGMRRRRGGGEEGYISREREGKRRGKRRVESMSLISVYRCRDSEFTVGWSVCLIKSKIEIENAGIFERKT
jgi:hypothetical protein